MKKLLFLLLILPFCSTAQVQLGVNAGVSYNNAPSNNKGGLGPVVGIKALVFTYKIIQIGVGIDYLQLSNSTDNYLYDNSGFVENYPTKNKSNTVSPYLVFNLLHNDNTLGFVAGPTLNMNRMKYYDYNYTTGSGEVIQYSQSSTHFGGFVGIQYGFVMPVSKHIGINPQIGARIYMLGSGYGSTIAIPLTIGILTRK